jgi:hypothetical protein
MPVENQNQGSPDRVAASIAATHTVGSIERQPLGPGVLGGYSRREAERRTGRGAIHNRLGGIGVVTDHAAPAALRASRWLPRRVHRHARRDDDACRAAWLSARLRGGDRRITAEEIDPAQLAEARGLIAETVARTRPSVTTHVLLNLLAASLLAVAILVWLVR